MFIYKCLTSQCVMRGIFLTQMVTTYNLLINDVWSICAYICAYIQLTCTMHVLKMAETYSYVLQRHRRNVLSCCLRVNATVMYVHQYLLTRPHWPILSDFRAFNFLYRINFVHGIIS